MELYQFEMLTVMKNVLSKKKILIPQLQFGPLVLVLEGYFYFLLSLQQFIINNDNRIRIIYRSENDILCVTDWSQKLFFYSVEEKGVSYCNFILFSLHFEYQFDCGVSKHPKIDREKKLGFEALSVNYMLKGEYILVAGCNKQCLLLSHDGVKLAPIGDEQESWIWCCKAHPSAPFVVSKI